MPESTLSLSHYDLEAEVADFLGFGRGTQFGETAWSTRQQKTITECVKSGLRFFYFPTPLPGDQSPPDWSFMRPTGRVTLVSGEDSVMMPDDFGGLEGVLRLIDSGRYGPIIIQTNEQAVSRRRDQFPDVTGQPLECAIRISKTTSLYKGQRAELLVYPEADQDYTVEFQYYFLPDSLSVSFPYALGGTTHSETIKAAVKAAAEVYQDNERGPMWEMFQDRMRASVGLDRRNKSQTVGYNSDPGYNRGQYRGRWADTIDIPITFDGVTPT